jgi:PST family polysaccharide transporter
VVIPVGIGASAIAPELVPVLYGDKWVAMVPIVTMLGLSTAVRGSVAVAAPIFNATDRVGLALAYGIVGTFLAAAAVAAGLRFGIDVVSAAVAVASLYSVIVFRAGIGLIGLGWRVVGSVLVPPLLAALVMWVAVALSRMYMTGAIGGAGIRMVAHILLGAAVYGIVLHMASREYLREFLALGRKLMRR